MLPTVFMSPGQLVPNWKLITIAVTPPMAYVIAGIRMWKRMFSPNWTRHSISASSIRLIYFAMLRDEREDRYTARGWWAHDTLTRWLARHLRERPDAPA